MAAIPSPTLTRVHGSSAAPAPGIRQWRATPSSRSLRGVAGLQLGVRQQASRLGARRPGAPVGVARAETKYLSSADAAKELVEKEGFRVVDVRDETQWERARIAGSTHLPYFIVNTDSGVETAIKRQAHMNFSGMLYGVAFTKPNPEFVTQAQQLFPDKSSKLLLVCQEGLRANSAVDELEDVGYTNLAVLEKGLNRVNPGLFEKEGTRELKDAGKGGFVAIQTQFSIVLASILLTALAFLQFFPDAALQILGETQ